MRTGHEPDDDQSPKRYGTDEQDDESIELDIFHVRVLPHPAIVVQRCFNLPKPEVLPVKVDTRVLCGQGQQSGGELAVFVRYWAEVADVERLDLLLWKESRSPILKQVTVLPRTFQSSPRPGSGQSRVRVSALSTGMNALNTGSPRVRAARRPKRLTPAQSRRSHREH